MTRYFLIEDFPMPVTNEETARYWQEKGKNVSELLPVNVDFKIENPRKITEGSGK